MPEGEHAAAAAAAAGAGIRRVEVDDPELARDEVFRLSANWEVSDIPTRNRTTEALHVPRVEDVEHHADEPKQGDAKAGPERALDEGST